MNRFIRALSIALPLCVLSAAAMAQHYEVRYIENRSKLELHVFTRATVDQDKFSCVSIEGDFKLIRYPAGFGPDGCATSISTRLGLNQYYAVFTYEVTGSNVKATVPVSFAFNNSILRRELIDYGFNGDIASPTITTSRTNLAFRRNELSDGRILTALINNNALVRTQPAHHFTIDSVASAGDCITQSEFVILGTPYWGSMISNCVQSGSALQHILPDGHSTVLFRATSRSNGSSLKIINLYVHPEGSEISDPLIQKRTNRLDGSSTSAKIYGGVRLNSRLIATEFVAPQEIKIQVVIEPEAEDFGKSALLFVVVELGGNQFILTQSRGLVPFSGSNLESFQTISSLTPHHELTLFSGLLDEADKGSYKIFVGYQPTDSSLGQLIYATEPIAFDVKVK
ncbi:MAG: hypothetical protein Q8L60_09150 [Gammaproteobacteria bacterium]|nr:hypothetical protein [Gammaproteobacteria bacterium]MDP2347352.1 hypothetical protein [Gammaproteobacteria bacterium]